MSRGGDAENPATFLSDATFDALQIGIWSFEVASARVWWSSEVYRLHGLAPGTPLHPLSTFEVMHPGDRERVARTLAAATADLKPFEYEYRVVLRNEEIRRLHVRAMPVVENGQLTGMRGVTQAALTRQADENSALDEARQISERVGALSPDLVLICDLATRRIVFGNRVVIDFLGIAASDLQSTDWTPYIHPDDVATLTLGKPSTDDTPTEWRFRGRRFDGEWRQLRARTIAIGRRPDRAPIWTFTVAEDITERSALLDATRAAKEAAEQAMRARSEFLANASHELRTPLGAILGYSDAMLDGVVGELSERQRSYVREIHSAGSVLLRLFTDLLELSRAEAGGLALRRSPVAAAELVHGALGLVAEMARRKDIELSHQIEARVGTVEVDPIRMRQVLWNLLANAVKFTPEGGRIEIKVERVQWRGSPAVSLAVTDTGIGIDEDEQRKLFQPFVRVHRTGSEVAGTGLGLAIVRRFVELHGGEVSVQSQPAHGSRFTVTLPQPASAESL